MASPQTLSAHPALGNLAFELKEIVAGWVEDLAKACLDPEPQELLANLDTLVFGNSASAKEIPERHLELIQMWLDQESNEGPILVLCKDALEGAGKTRRIPRATPDQIKIILEAQEEVGVFWPDTQLRELTRWQADTIIKGLMVRSEVKRSTGSYDYPIRRLRRAVREDLSRPQEGLR